MLSLLTISDIMRLLCSQMSPSNDLRHNYRKQKLGQTVTHSIPIGNKACPQTHLYYVVREKIVFNKLNDTDPGFPAFLWGIS